MRSIASPQRLARDRSSCGRWHGSWSSGSVMIATWPFQKTRSPRREPRKVRARLDRGCRSSRPACRNRAARCLPAMRIDKLHQAGAVDAEAAGAAPQIGRVDQRLGDRDIVAGGARAAAADAWRSSPRRRQAARRRVPRVSAAAGDRDPRAHRQLAGLRQLQVGAGIDEGARHRNDMRRHGRRDRRARRRRHSRHSRRARPGSRPSLRRRRRRGRRRRTAPACSGRHRAAARLRISATGDGDARRPAADEAGASTSPRRRSSARSGRKA